MTNRFEFPLLPDDLRWAAAEGVSEDVIAAVLLLHERRVDEIVQLGSRGPGPGGETPTAGINAAVDARR